jgi:DNA primase
MDAREMKEMFGDRVAQLIGSRLEKWDARRMKGCCPIHSDKTPSFSYDMGS